jgi:hypothetical protein
MKLRLKGNSLRLRVTRSELARLQAGEQIDETVFFPTSSNLSLTYSFAVGSYQQPVHVSFHASQILVSVSPDQLASWSGEHQVGIYASLPVAKDMDLEVSIEKDFACLDLSDAENVDTFTNPLAEKTC